MNSGKHILSWLFVLLLFCWSMNAQQTSSLTGWASVPRLVNFSGKATDIPAKPSLNWWRHLCHLQGRVWRISTLARNSEHPGGR